jgi:hypothetical protein
MGRYRGLRLGDIYVVEEKPMAPVCVALVLFGVAGATLGLPVLAQKPSTPAATGTPLNACTILSRDEVKKIVPWGPEADREKEYEQPLVGGSGCVYPSVAFVVYKYSVSRIDAARKDGPLIPVPGTGDAAFLQQKKHWAELYVKVGDRMVHITQIIPSDGTFESVKPSMVALGKALVAKLR